MANAVIIYSQFLNAISLQVSSVLDLSQTLSNIEELPAANGILLNYEAQMAQLEEEIAYLRKMKLRIYEDLVGEIIDKTEYADYRRQYTEQIEEKTEALERLRREKKDALVCGEAEKIWVTLFRQYENINSLNRRVLMALIDKILVYEDHSLEVVFRYGDEYRRMSEFVHRHEELLRQSDKNAALTPSEQEV